MILIDGEAAAAFRRYLEERENSRATVEKYLRDLGQLADFCGGGIPDKGALLAFKEELLRLGYRPASVNSKLAAVNRFLCFAGRPEWKLRFLKVQRQAFASGERELARTDYERLVAAARGRGDERLALLTQVLCATGIRVSELRAVTVESLRTGRAELRSKGKIRQILLPAALCRRLEAYCRKRGVRRGCVFVTRTGRPLDRSNIWKMLKRLAGPARVSAGKVFPHNLRHLFARTYYRTYKDIVRLADILGHASVDTTRVYTAHDGREQRRQLERLPLLL